jgi:iron complex transport system substrate-binding protein
VRIVSMLPSATEIVYALGLDEDLVGVTFECNEPPRARREKRIVVGGRDTSAMTPGDIDRYVRDQLAAGEDLYTLDTGALAEIAPDVILTQDLCRVCALPTNHVEDALDYLGCRADVVSLDPHTLDDVLDSIKIVGKRLGVEQRADKLVDALRVRLDAVAARVAAQPRPRVAVLEWIDPPFTGGHWVPDLIIAAGGQPVVSDPGEHSRERSWDDIVDVCPDLVLVSPCGFDLDGAAVQAVAVVERLPGVPVWAIDADALVVRPGPRLVDGVEAIATALHPDMFDRQPPGIRRIA